MTPQPEQEVVEQILAHGREHGRRALFGQGQVPSLSYYYRVAGQDVSLYLVYLKPGGATVAVSIGGVNAAKHLGPEQAMEYLGRLRDIPEIAPHLAHLDADNLNRYPAIPIIGVLTEPGVLGRFLTVLDSFRLTTVNEPA